MTTQAIPNTLTPVCTWRRLRRWLGALAMAAGALPAVAALLPSEVQVLKDLYTSTNGASWGSNDRWMNGGDPCASGATWFGITCDATGTHVTGVSLGGNKLSGSLPDTLNSLTALQTFYAHDNQLTGAIPSLSGLTALQSFLVGSNQFTGAIPSLSGLNSLQSFYVNNNRLTGAIPSLSGLNALQYFGAQNNQLSGTIPSLSGLTALQTFIVSDNQLTGAIPSLSGLTALQGFWAGNNQLTGAIPSLDGLTALDSFLVGSNQLTGTIPSLSGLTALHVIQVQYNQLTGSPPAPPASMQAGYSFLCPNYLSTPSASDADWNIATFHNPWNTNCPATAPIYDVTVIAGAGTASPGASTGGPGATPTISITPPAGQVVKQVSSTCGVPNGQAPAVTNGPLTSFTSLPLIASCTIEVSYEPAPTPIYNVTVNAGVGTASPSAPTGEAGATPSIAITPPAGQVVKQVSSTCGVPSGQPPVVTNGPLTSFTTLPLNADCTIDVSYEPAPSPVYNVTVNAGAGTASPGALTGEAGATPTIAITPPAGQVVKQVSSTCGVPSGQPPVVTNGPLTSFTTLPLHADCTIDVSYAPASVAAVPTLGDWTLMALGLLLTGLGVARWPGRRQRL